MWSLTALQLREALHPPPPLTGRPTLTGGSRLTRLPTFPERTRAPAIPTDLHRRQFTESYRSTRVLYLEETLKGDLICCLQFTGEETEAQKGSECPPGIQLAGLKALSVFRPCVPTLYVGLRLS